MNYEEMIEGYNDLRDKCVDLAKKDNGKLMGSDSWLRNSILSEDITLDYSDEGIHCNGYTYTSQTMGNEPFMFVIPFGEIENA
jgi:hypothetical protein